MKNYETPELTAVELSLANEIASTFTEGSDNETGWLDKWTSGINGQEG